MGQWWVWCHADVQLVRRVTGRVGATHRCVTPPSEPGERVAPHPAQATGREFKVADGTPADWCSRVTFTHAGIQLFPWISPLLPVLSTRHPATSAPFQVGYYPIRRVMSSPVPFGMPAFACWPSYPAKAWALPYSEPTAEGRPYRGFHVPHRQEASGELASLRRERGTVSAEPQISADLCSSKDVSATCVPLCVTTLQPRLHLRSTRSQLFLA